MGVAIRTYVYVDGFNLYYGAVKNTPFRWLNLLSLSQQLLPGHCTIDKIKYFTARVSGAEDPSAPARQHTYLAALATIPQVEVHFGRFLAKTIWRPIVNFPVAGQAIHSGVPAVTLPAGDHQVAFPQPQTLPVKTYPQHGTRRKRKAAKPLADALIVEVHTMEEKGSDVNLAAHLLNDAWANLFDAAVVISNDTDLVTPIQMVSVQRQKPVFVVCPGRWQMSPHLQKVATHVRHIHNAMLRAAQFPDPIPGTTIRKPAKW